MTTRVTMTHETLPGQPIEVAEAAVRHHERAGWRVQGHLEDSLPNQSAMPTMSSPGGVIDAGDDVDDQAVDDNGDGDPAGDETEGQE